MRLDRLIANQPRFSRQDARRLLAAGSVSVDGRVTREGNLDIRAFSQVVVEDQVIQSGQPARYLMLNKPAGYISATHDTLHPTVLDLLDPLDRDDLHIAGRLDGNTTGLLIVTNDGRWSRRLTEPQSLLGKVYLVETGHDIHPDCVEQFAAGFYFAYEGLTTRPARLELLGARHARLTLHEGRYHQVKRMFGRFRNPVIALHRERIGSIALDPTLQPGQYRPLTATEIASI